MASLATIVIAAGKGTRMRSKRPKVLHEIAGDPMLMYPLEAADAVGSRQIVCVLGYGIEEVQAVLAQRDFKTKARLQFVRQKQLSGTADAVKTAQAVLAKHGGDILILCGDVPFIKAKTLRAFLKRHRAGRYAVSVLSSEVADPSGYGRIVRAEDGSVVKIVEQIDASAAERRIQEINAGIYLFKKELLFRNLRKVKRNRRKGEYYLTDLIEIIAKGGEKVGAHHMADAIEILGINSRGQLAEANLLAREYIHYFWMDRGVEFLDPATAQVDRSVKLAADVTIGPGCVLRGKTRVKAGAFIDAGSVIVDTLVGENAQIKSYCVLEESRIDEASQVGPFAHLRPGSHVEAGAKVGNFVELKKTRLGAGAKANHLSYLGDATVGGGANIGAGTITCNYDGINKYKTKIGPRSFIGSDTQLIAPVSIGTEAYVGAGSTITKNVPAGALSVSRSAQVNIAGWARRKQRRKR